MKGCGFILNRHGGTLLLGVNDDSEIQGIGPDTIEQVRKDFVTGINNPQKLAPPTCLSINEEVVDGKKLLRIYVPESSQVHRCNGRIYDRNENGVLTFQKNPILSAFFREIDRADELGSGMRKLMLYGKKYGGADPQLIEGDSFRMIIATPEFGDTGQSQIIL